MNGAAWTATLIRRTIALPVGGSPGAEAGGTARLAGEPAMPQASYPLRATGGLAVISAPGMIPAADADRLRAALLAAAGLAATIVVDMSRTWHCDPAGLHVLHRAHQRAQGGHGELRLVLPLGPVLRELAGAGRAAGIPCYTSLRAALAAAPAAQSPRPRPPAAAPARPA
jgi:anti-anti-sigma regulatory factor